MGRSIRKRLSVEAADSGLCLPGLPVLEIAGESRVLIENHAGVMAYSRDRIMVKVSFGCYSICGSKLEIRRMTKEQLVICGKIRTVTLQGRENL